MELNVSQESTVEPPSEIIGAREAYEELRDALAQAGLTLPSLAPDYGSLTGTDLVELGRVRPQVAAWLAAVIRRGMER
ncbi:hypothetical protein [Streptomyces sp. NPDC056661]|uniref:hypothetical protein n=1 Tax=Streptomyces sp. NPDC056661 TaxID=3345898 RepID=UPI0036CE0299